MQNTYFLVILAVFFIGCKQTSEKKELYNPSVTSVKYAEGFAIEDFETHKLITLSNPWPGADVSYTYLLKKGPEPLKEEADVDAVISIPLDNIVVTSTTHIPSLEMLGLEDKLIGFPNLDYISSEKTRALINNGSIKELGKNEDLNTEVLIDLSPDAVVTFAVEGSNKTVGTIQKTGIPVLYNSDWT
nr:ABC transporter substrate-binding protein [Bacteroidota bacterium]